MTKLTKLDLQELELQLKKSSEEIEEELKSMAVVPDSGSDVDHFDEETDEAEDYSTNLGIKDALKERLEEIKCALAKIAKGTYGKCEKCGADIELAVLKTSPESRYCQAHKK